MSEIVDISVQIPAVIPEDWELELLAQKQIEREFGLSKWTFIQGEKTGIIGNITAPRYQRRGCNPVISRAEFARFIVRMQRFRRTFLTYEELDELMQSHRAHVATSARHVRLQISTRGHYYSIVAPPAYQFINNRRKHFHRNDVLMMKSYVIKRLNNQLRARSAIGWRPDMGVWLPPYGMPFEAEYDGQYKETTLVTMQSWHALLLPPEPRQAVLPFDQLPA